MRALHKILVVDDDPVVGKSFNRVLSNKGYVVITAQNAREAFTKLSEGGYEAIFTDIRMPGMDGLELAERVKARQPWTPVVIITGHGTLANEARAKAVGVTAFLHKPLSPEMIEDSAVDALRAVAPTTPIVARLDATVTRPVAVAPVANESMLKNIALFMAAPFIGLAYAVMFPFVGLALLTRIAFEAMAKNPTAAKVLVFMKNVALFAVAPFIGLAYAVLLPFIGMGLLATIGFRALAKVPSVRNAAAFVKQAAMFMAAPFIGLAFILALPLVGTVMLAWVGTKALTVKANAG